MIASTKSYGRLIPEERYASLYGPRQRMVPNERQIVGLGNRFLILDKSLLVATLDGDFGQTGRRALEVPPAVRAGALGAYLG